MWGHGMGHSVRGTQPPPEASPPKGNPEGPKMKHGREKRVNRSLRLADRSSLGVSTQQCDGRGIQKGDSLRGPRRLRGRWSLFLEILCLSGPDRDEPATPVHWVVAC